MYSNRRAGFGDKMLLITIHVKIHIITEFIKVSLKRRNEVQTLKAKMFEKVAQLNGGYQRHQMK